ncbi:PKD domain-containing protein [Cryomorphaceae bacterium 1068]|nr:PKD domain-containing protein [Cryomorphaceae bacterium 1068]
MKFSFPLAKVLAFFAFFAIAIQAFSDHHPTPFVLNAGQWDAPFNYKAEFNNLSVFAEPEGFTFLAKESIEHHDHGDLDHEHHIPDMINVHAFSLKFEGAEQIVFEGEGRLDSYYNYFLGKNKENWKGHVPLFNSLSTNDIYDGIRLKVISEGGNFKYDYIVDAGSSPSQIVFSYIGQNSLELVDGKLKLITSVGDFVESIPISYQIIDGERRTVRCNYIETSSGSFAFEFPEGYDEGHELIIDPVLVAATLSGTGGSSSNFGHGAAFDLAGNIYTHAISFNSDYPVTMGAFQEVYGGGGTDVVISKLTPDGTDLIFATFVGGSGSDSPFSTIVNANQEIYIYGRTDSENFPTSPGAIQEAYGGSGDIFVTGLSLDGSELVGSTYLGGNAADGSNVIFGAGYDALRGEINLNFNGEVFISSSSSSANFPTTDGSLQPIKKEGQDAVVVKMSAGLDELVWSTFVGSDGNDMAYGVRMRDDQTVYIAGAVSGSNDEANELETTAGAYQEEYAGGDSDGFVARLSADGSEMVECTFLGLANNDILYFLDLDSNNDVWVYTYSTSTWETTDGVWGTSQSTLLVNKLSSDLSELEITSYVTNQGSASGNPVAFMVDLCNGVYISAFGVTNDFIASEDALFSTGGFYVGVFEPDMEGLIYGTYYTGTHVDGGTSRFDTQGIVYQGVCSGGGFNTTDDAWATGQSTGWDIGVFKIDFEIETVNAVASAAGQLTGCAPHTVTFDNFSEGESYLWDFGNGDQSEDYEPVYVYEEEGEYLVTLVVIDSATCNISDTLFIPFQVFEPVEFFADFDYSIDCLTGIIEITDASQGPADLEYTWDMGDGTSYTEVNPTHTYDEPGEYTLTLTLESDACNQEIIEEVIVVYSPFVTADFNVQVIEFCDEFLIGIADNSSNAEDYIWDMGDGTTLSNPGSFEYNYEESGTYDIQLIVSNETTCDGIDSVTFSIEVPEPPVLDPQVTLTQQGLCEDLNVFGVLEPNGPLGTVSWTINDEEIGTEPVLEWQAPSAGSYNFVITLTDAVCDDVYIVEEPFDIFENLGYTLPPSSFLCYYEDDLILDATVPYPDAEYIWNGGESLEPTFTVTDEGEFTVQVFFNGCEDQQTAEVSIGQEVPLNFEASICEDQSNIVTMPENQYLDQILWDDGQTGFAVEVFNSGYYAFTAIDIVGCDQVDSLFAIPLDDDPNLQIPNIFTPNGDGFNDTWQITGDPLVYFDLSIFNRWGREVFKTNEIYAPWEGQNDEGSGNDHNDDTFIYILKYRDQCDLENLVETGDLKLLR